MDITYRTEYGILEVRPTGKLNSDDFESLGEELDGLLSDSRTLKGVLIYTEAFPGYESLSDVVAHGKFIGENRDRIPKVALCTDSPVAFILPALGKLFAEADVKHFAFNERDEAEKWLLA